jgi:transcriptional regulator with XRE-family HTH domain
VNRVQEIRKPKMTQRELAERSGLSLRVIQAIEAGENTTLKTLQRIADALGVGLHELLAGSTEEKTA